MQILMFVQQSLLSIEPAHKTLSWQVFNSFADINDRHVTSHCVSTFLSRLTLMGVYTHRHISRYIGCLQIGLGKAKCSNNYFQVERKNLFLKKMRENVPFSLHSEAVQDSGICL